MLYKVSPMGYFGKNAQFSRGPWFHKHIAEDDGLEWYYTYFVNGERRIMLSSNLAFDDRENMSRLFKAYRRTEALAALAGLFLSVEVITRAPYFKQMAYGWKFLSFVGVAVGFKQLFSAYNSQTYGPIMGAYARKYSESVKSDYFEIQDRKREFYQIDTS